MGSLQGRVQVIKKTIHLITQPKFRVRFPVFVYLASANVSVKKKRTNPGTIYNAKHVTFLLSSVFLLMMSKLYRRVCI